MCHVFSSILPTEHMSMKTFFINGGVFKLIYDYNWYKMNNIFVKVDLSKYYFNFLY